MARKRVWRGNTPTRYQAKLARTLKGVVPEDFVVPLSSESLSEYSSGFGVYRKIYADLLKYFGERIPKMMRGLYRSALFAMVKAYDRGYPVEAVIEKFANPREGGLDRALLEDIARHFGLLEASEEKAAG